MQANVSNNVLLLKKNKYNDGQHYPTNPGITITEKQYFRKHYSHIVFTYCGTSFLALQYLPNVSLQSHGVKLRTSGSTIQAYLTHTEDRTQKKYWKLFLFLKATVP